jgi:hypothetical protein
MLATLFFNDLLIDRKFDGTWILKGNVHLIAPLYQVGVYNSNYSRDSKRNCSTLNKSTQGHF